jgi:hypothetical protein
VGAARDIGPRNETTSTQSSLKGRPGRTCCCGAADPRNLDLVAEPTDAQNLLSLADGKGNRDQLGLTMIACSRSFATSLSSAVSAASLRNPT